MLAATLELPEVCIWMESTLLRGNRTVKVNSSGLDAFESPKCVRRGAGWGKAPPEWGCMRVIDLGRGCVRGGCFRADLRGWQ